jgi:hypothetical protein
MKKQAVVSGAFALALFVAATGRAQVKEIPGETEAVSGSVEAIDHANRVLTLRGSEGDLVTVDIPANARRFDEIKVGDKVTVKYYDNVVVRLKAAGEKSTNTRSAAVTPGRGDQPGATVAAQRTMTATVDAIDPKVPSITFTGPNGWKYSRRVMDKKALSQVKVGDQVDFTWTEAVTISIDEPKK